MCVQTRDALMQRVVNSAKKEGLELDMLSWSGRTTLEVLGQAGLGVSFDPLIEDRPDAFADAVKEFLCVLSDPWPSPLHILLNMRSFKMLLL